MAYSIACKDMGSDCRGTFMTESEEELMVHAEMHVMAAHSAMKLDEATRQQIKGLIKQT